MANPLDVLQGAPVTITNEMQNAFKDLIKVQGVSGIVTLWDLLDYLARNTGGTAGVSLGDLNDVDFKNALVGGQALVYNSMAQQWENINPNAYKVPITQLETVNLAAAAIAKDVQVQSVRFSVTADGLFHLYGRFDFGAVPQTPGDVFDLLDNDFFLNNYGFTLTSGFGNGGVFFNSNVDGVARLNAGKQIQIATSNPCSGPADINCLMTTLFV